MIDILYSSVFSYRFNYNCNLFSQFRGMKKNTRNRFSESVAEKIIPVIRLCILKCSFKFSENHISGKSTEKRVIHNSFQIPSFSFRKQRRYSDVIIFTHFFRTRPEYNLSPIIGKKYALLYIILTGCKRIRKLCGLFVRIIKKLL